MKKILTIALLICFAFIVNVKAQEYDDLDDVSSNQNATLNRVVNDAHYEVDLFWEQLEYNYVLTNYNSELNSGIYSWQPLKVIDSDDGYESLSNTIFATNHSNVPVIIGFSWVSELDIVATYDYSQNSGNETCVSIDGNDISWDAMFYTNDTCTIEANEITENGTYYYKVNEFEFVSNNNNSFVLNPSVVEYSIPPRYDHKWNLNLSGQVNIDNLTENMIIGTLTISLSSVD